MMDTGKSQEFTSPVENGTGECVTGLGGGEYKTHREILGHSMMGFTHGSADKKPLPVRLRPVKS